MRLNRIITIVFLLALVIVMLTSCTIEQNEERVFPADYWPTLMKSSAGTCVDLSGFYETTITRENKLVGGFPKFPPGKLSSKDGAIRIIQKGCTEINIDYQDRWKDWRTNKITQKNNNLQWHSDLNLFSYSVTALEPDGFGGKYKHRNEIAYLGKGSDSSLLCEHIYDLRVALCLITTHKFGNQKFRFKYVRQLKESERRI
jgi:hypothetical protein